MSKFRTHFGGELTKNDINENVKIAGWVENIRDHGGVIFLDIRDYHGIVQIVSNDNSVFDGITKESVVCVQGVVRERSADDINDKIKSGAIEILVAEITVLSKALNTLPFDVKTSKRNHEDTRLKYRYLDMRNQKVSKNMVFRSQVIDFLRKLMVENNFLEIQTPILTVSSPEGARDFIIPSRKHHGKFYSLPQAPQQFKQLLMVSGFDRYFQIAPCFRDEDARSDRIYGEFYQLDFEMCFADQEDVYEIGEKIFYETFQKFTDKTVDKPPFTRLSYQTAMQKYGTDKPDLRNPLEIIDLTNIFRNTEFKPFRNVPVRGIVVNDIADKPNAWFNELVAYANSIGMPGIGYFKVNDDMSLAGPIDKFLQEQERDELLQQANLKAGSVVFFIADRKAADKYAGLIRTELGRKLNLIDENRFAMCIVEDFPMYEWNEEMERYDFTHNPFSMPKGGLAALDDPSSALAMQYDFVCNGVELATGAVRNHDLDIMRQAFAIAGYDEAQLQARFGGLYQAFQYGAPPHAGMAPGIDRIIMLLLGEENIRETIAFPMNASGQDLMMGAPAEVSEKQLREAHIKVRAKN